MNQFLFLSVANALSMIVVAYSIVPVVAFFISPTKETATWIAAVLVTPMTAELLKRTTVALGMLDWCARPAGARDCDTWNRNGPQEGTPGFPSGHTATTVAFWMGAYILWPHPLTAIMGGIATAAMIWARMHKRCHTLAQTLGGGMLGAGISYGMFHLFKN